MRGREDYRMRESQTRRRQSVLWSEHVIETMGKCRGSGELSEEVSVTV